MYKKLNRISFVINGRQMHPMDFQKVMTVAVIDDSEDIKFGSTAVWCGFCNIGISF